MEPGVIMATQSFKRNLFLNLYRKGKKKITLVCFLLPLKREKCLTLFHLETPGLPACYPLIMGWLGHGGKLGRVLFRSQFSVQSQGHSYAFSQGQKHLGKFIDLSDLSFLFCKVGGTPNSPAAPAEREVVSGPCGCQDSRC